MLNSGPKVEILLATYNGAERLGRQIQSVIEQSYINWRLLIRDDGSDDGTQQIIKYYVSLLPGKVVSLHDDLGRLGPSRNFSSLMAQSSAEYLMLCDQDDIWLPEKVELSLCKMIEVENSGERGPILIHTDLKIISDDSVVVAGSLWQYQNIHPHNRESLNRLLVQNVVTGCTVMINKALRDLALPVPSAAVMHDWWLALVASAFGIIGHVDQATMLYRQHDANEIGAKRWGVAFVLKNLFGNDGLVREGILNAQKQAHVFLEKFQDKLPEETRKVVECFANIDQRPYLGKIYLLIKHRLFKAGLVRNLGFWTHI